MRRGIAVWLAVGLVLAGCGPSADQRVAEKVVEIDVALRAGDLAAAQGALKDAESIRRAEIPAQVRNRVVQRMRGQEALRSAEFDQRRGDHLAANASFQQAMSLDPWFEEVALEGIAATRSAFIEEQSIQIRDALDAVEVEEALAVFAEAVQAFPNSDTLDVLREEVAMAVDEYLTDEIRTLIASGDLLQARETLRRVAGHLGETTDLLEQLTEDADSAVREVEEARRAERERALQEQIERDLRQALDAMQRWWADVHWAARNVMCIGFDERPIRDAERWGAQAGVSAEHAAVFLLDVCEDQMRRRCTHYSTHQLCSGLIDWSHKD
jgi:tetratricopeptide (TPR) repeat protein